MLALRKTAPEFGLDIQEIAAPDVPGPDDLLVEVAAAGICGSDLHVYEWSRGYEFMADRLPTTLGHEFAGRVLAIGGNVADFKPGDAVTVWPTVACGTCLSCAAGRPQECGGRRIIGLHVDGAFAERVIVPAGNCFRLPRDLPLDVAALAEPLCIAINAVEVAEVRPGDSVLVLGPGPIGLAVAWLAQDAGCDPVVLAGLNDPARLHCARRMGIRHRVELAQDSLDMAVQRICGRPVDRVIEATGVARSIPDGLAVLRPGGILVVAGIHSEMLELDLTCFVREKKQLRAAHDATRAAWDRAVALLAAHGDALAQMISHKLPLERALEGFELARRKEAVKVLLVPSEA